MLLVVTVLGMALNTISRSDVTVSANLQESQEALALAESGFAHARALLAWPNMQFDDFLQGGDDATPCSGDELMGKFKKGAKVPKDFPKAPDMIPAAGRQLGAGTYRVAICDDHALEQLDDPPDNNPSADKNGRIIVRSIGTGRNGAVSAIEIVFGYGIGLPAISINGNTRLEDKMRLLGEQGGAYVNGFLELEGDPCAQLSFAASGFIRHPEKSRRAPGCSLRGRTQQFNPFTPVPDLNIADYIWTTDDPPQPVYDYFLGKDGKVKDAAGTVLATNVWKDKKNKEMWKWDGGGHRWNGKAELVEKDGIYYSDANIRIEENPGKGKPVRLTLITEGYVDVDGDLENTPAMTTKGGCLKCDRIKGVLPGAGIAVIAGTDLKLKKNGKLQGIFYARDQVRMENNFELFGQILALNQDDAKYLDENLVKWDGKDRKLHVKGQQVITYDGEGFTPDANNGPQVLGWRECRGLDPTDPCG
jgi:hypothetical protein